MPPKRIGPSVAGHAMRQAIQMGRSHRFSKTGYGTYIDTLRGRFNLQRADGSLKDAGLIYCDELGIPPPTLYTYDQDLIQDKFVRTYKGNKLLVRKWNPSLNGGSGDWQVTKAGENYFKYNRDEYLHVLSL